MRKKVQQLPETEKVEIVVQLCNAEIFGEEVVSKLCLTRLRRTINLFVPVYEQDTHDAREGKVRLALEKLARDFPGIGAVVHTP